MDIIKVNKALMLAAHDRAMSRPYVFKGSHRGREGMVVGALGEMVVASLLESWGVEFAQDDETTHDFRLPQGWTIEVKTKDRAVPPRPEYECTIPLYNHDHQLADCYVFVSLRRAGIFSQHKFQFSEAYVVGAISRTRLDKIAKRWNAGDVDQSNGTKFWTDCLNVSVSDCVPLRDAVGWMQGRAKKI